MKRQHKVVLLLSLLAFFFLGKEFMPEVFALGWHVRHGRTVRLRSFDGRKYVLDVPLLFWPQVDENGWNVVLIKRSGPLRASLGQTEFATLSFSVVNQYSTGEELREWASALNQNPGLVLTQVASVRVGGKDVYCFDQKWEKGKMPDLGRKFPMVEIMCVPLSDKRGFSSSYLGSSRFLPVFYDVLSTVKRVN